MRDTRWSWISAPMSLIAHARSRLRQELVDRGSGRMNLCPRCRLDLTAAVRAHLYRCAMLPSEVRRRAQAVREAAQRLVKENHQLRDKSDVLIREAEAMLFETQRALREAMSKRTAS